MVDNPISEEQKIAYVLADGKQYEYAVALAELLGSGSVIVTSCDVAKKVTWLLDAIGMEDAVAAINEEEGDDAAVLVTTEVRDGFACNNPEGWYWRVSGGGDYTSAADALSVAAMNR